MTITAAAGDLIQLVGRRDQKSFIFRLEPSQKLETHRGVVQHDDLIGQSYGQEVFSHLGSSFFLLTPSTADLLRTLRRSSQIIFPKDVGLILLKLGVQPGQMVVEAGTGSGSLTLALARAVGPAGRVISYDVRQDMQNLARRNLERVGLVDRATFKLRDIAAGFDETDVPALFLDVPNPWDYLAQVYRALQGGGFFGALAPTVNQITELLVALQRESYSLVEVIEVLLRSYKTVPARVRPQDRMVAHTGYLVFARTVIHAPKPPAGRPEPAVSPESEPDS